MFLCESWGGSAKLDAPRTTSASVGQGKRSLTGGNPPSTEIEYPLFGRREGGKRLPPRRTMPGGPQRMEGSALSARGRAQSEIASPPRAAPQPAAPPLSTTGFVVAVVLGLVFIGVVQLGRALCRAGDRALCDGRRAAHCGVWRAAGAARAAAGAAAGVPRRPHPRAASPRLQHGRRSARSLGRLRHPRLPAASRLAAILERHASARWRRSCNICRRGSRPRMRTAIRRVFPGQLRPGGVPWALWLRPLAIWLTFWVALFGVAWCLMLLFRRQWLQYERLSFPLLTLPLALTSEGEALALRRPAAVPEPAAVAGHRRCRRCSTG